MVNKNGLEDTDQRSVQLIFAVVLFSAKFCSLAFLSCMVVCIVV